jgi:hypothetical protein
MPFRIAFFVLIMTSVPAFAQTATTSGANSTVNISNPANTSSTAKLITTPTVVAPGLAVAGIETCLGSASTGISVMGAGITLGGTTPDEGCNIRLTSRQLQAFGHPRAALALMCQDARVAAAMATAGEECPHPGDVTPVIESPSKRQQVGKKKIMFRQRQLVELRH